MSDQNQAQQQEINRLRRVINILQELLRRRGQAGARTGREIEEGIEMQPVRGRKKPEKIPKKIDPQYERQRREELRQKNVYAPQLIRGWMRGQPDVHQEFGGVKPKRYDESTDYSYDYFPTYDTVSPNLRRLAPINKPLSDEDAQKLAAGGITFGNKIGAGAFGQVWEATFDNRPVVVKRMAAADFMAKRADYPTYQGSINMVEEMKAMHRLCNADPQHPNIVGCDFIWRVYQEDTMFPDPIAVLMFLERCDADVQDLMESSIPHNITLTDDDCRKLCVTMFHALDFCHSRGLVHLDLKPANIMVKREATGSKRAKFVMADFGIAQIFDEDVDFRGRKTGQYTMEVDSYCGTTLYSPDEMLKVQKGHPIDPRPVDVWTMGITALISLIGFAPYMKNYQRKNHGTNGEFKGVRDCIVGENFNQLPKFDKDYLKNHYHIDEGVFNYIKFILNVRPRFRPTPTQAIEHQWAAQWPYDGGFVELNFLP